jgi:hypothetical protein
MLVHMVAIPNSSQQKNIPKTNRTAKKNKTKRFLVLNRKK